VPATPEDFVREHLPDAERAAATLGVDAELLLAQAALETGWGSAMPRYPDGSAANNLFGIKAGASWEGPRVSRWTLEHNGGFAERRREQFRAYASTADSFSDYVELIRGSERYQAALTSADQAESYARGIADSGYATDPDYADKWLAIYRGETLKSAVAELK
jgi:flagellar protein FlgJ